MFAPGKVSLTNAGIAIFTITEGTEFVLSENYYGYDDGTHSAWSGFGSINPASLNGVGIEAIMYGTFGTDEFYVILQGNRAQSFFDTVTPQDGSTLDSSAATRSYSGAGDYTQWLWSGVTIPGRWDGSGTSTVKFTL